MMKKINLSAMAILLGTALAFAGNKSISLPKVQEAQWFYLEPGTNAAHPDNYRLMKQGDDCSGDGERCAILAEQDAQNPNKPSASGVANPILVEERTVTL